MVSIGIPQVDFYSMLSGLGDTIAKNRDAATKQAAITSAFTPGPDGKIDYNRALTTLAPIDPQAAALVAQRQNHEDTLKQQAIDNARNSSNDARSASQFQQTYGLQKRTADRLDEDKYVIKEVTDPNTGATTLVRVKTTGGEGPINSGVAPSTPNNPFSSGGKFNGDQGKAAGFTDRMLQSEGILSGVGPNPGAEGPISPGVQGEGADWAATQASRAKTLPGIGGMANYAVPEVRQKYDQAKADFINAQLRRESGAAIGASEFTNADKQYFPVPGDTPAVIKQKAANRRAAIEAMGREGGGSYRPKMNFDENGTLTPYGQPAPAAARPAAPAPPKIGQLIDGYRYKGGDPADQNSWVKSQ